MITLEHFYLVLGAMLAVAACMALRERGNPRRHATALFWALYAALYLGGERLPPEMAGAAMIAMALIAGFGGVSPGAYRGAPESERRAGARRLGHWLFLPALLVPLTTMVGTTLLRDVHLGAAALFETGNATLVSLGCGALLALVAACRLTGANAWQGMREWRRLVDSMGYTVVLPHMLAVLGLLFAEAGVGKAVAQLTNSYVAMDARFVAVAVFCIGMALLTVVMGNGFAAFPVMAGGVGIPVLVGVYHADAALMAAIGMFSAYCGTLMTPMAANFNIVPVALLELPDKNAVIKAQLPTALPLLAANILLLYFLMNR